MIVSVVVPTRGRPALLQRCLDALIEQEFDPSAYEVLVVVDGPDQTTRQVVREAALRSRTGIYSVWQRGAKGPAAARNRGWRLASGQIVAFTDDDCIPDPQWLRAGVEAFLMEGVVGASGRIRTPLPSAPTDYERTAAGREETPFVTANAFYRREALDACGGFDERFTSPWREDTDLFFSTLERGGVFVRVPQAIVMHPIRPARWGISVPQQRNNFFDALLFKKHPALYGIIVTRTPPWRYYAITLAGLVGVWMALQDHPLSAIIAGGLWAWGTLVFCAGRLKGTAHTPSHITEMLVTSVLIPPAALMWRLAGALRFRAKFF